MTERNLVRPAVLFAAGFVFAAIVGFWVVVDTHDPRVFAGATIGAGIAGGLLSARYGRRFWEAIRHLPWFVP